MGEFVFRSESTPKGTLRLLLILGEGEGVALRGEWYPYARTMNRTGEAEEVGSQHFLIQSSN